MGKLAVYKYMAMMFLVIQIIITVFTIVALYGGDVSPIGNTARSLLVYALPLLIIANILLLPYWLIRRRWIHALIPIITIACCIPYIGTIFQFGSYDKSAEAKTGLKIATYNVAMFGRETSGFRALDILAEMRRQKVDVLSAGVQRDQRRQEELHPLQGVFPLYAGGSQRHGHLQPLPHQGQQDATLRRYQQ